MLTNCPINLKKCLNSLCFSIFTGSYHANVKTFYHENTAACTYIDYDTWNLKGACQQHTPIGRRIEALSNLLKLTANFYTHGTIQAQTLTFSKAHYKRHLIYKRRRQRQRHRDKDNDAVEA